MTGVPLCHLTPPFYCTMSGITSIGTNNPEYYAELLKNITRSANWRPPSDETCPNIPGIQGVDGPPARRVQTLLDIVANISLCQQRNVSATMACLRHNKGTLETRLHIVFNHQNDDAARGCPEHLKSIFQMLRRVHYKFLAMGGPPKVIKELGNDLIEISMTIHNFSFDIFAHRVTKHKCRLSYIWGYIEQDRKRFTPEQRSTLAEFFLHMDRIIKIVDNAKATKKLSMKHTRILICTHSYWMAQNLLPQNALVENKRTLLDHVDTWLADSACSDT